MKLTASTSGAITSRSCWLPAPGVEVGGGRAADQRVGTGKVVHDFAQFGDKIEALGGARRILSGDHDPGQLAVVGLTGRMCAHHAVEVVDGVDHLVGVRGVRDDEDRLRDSQGGKCSASTSRPAADSDCTRNFST